MNKLLQLIFLTFSLFPVSARETSPEELAEMKEGLNDWRELVSTFNTLPRNEAIEELGRGLYKTSLTSIYRLDEREEVRKEIQTALFSIPGHAEYYRDKIEGLTIPYLKSSEVWGKTGKDPMVNGKYIGTLYGELDRARMWSLETLRELPSPETLRVLGEMLNDERMRIKLLPDKSNLEEVHFVVSNSQKAAYTLHQMIESPPTGMQYFDYDRDIPVWQNWWRQVKEGSRTVRFKGDPQEYGFSGPVREAKNPDIPRATKRPSTVNEVSPESSKPSRPLPTAWIAGTIAAIFAGISWIILKRSKSI
jgi:hypothetical protein